MAVQAELCELTLRQVFERTSHSSGRYPVETNFRLWPKAEVDPDVANGCKGQRSACHRNLANDRRSA
jgi:hypothetical protein